MKTLKDYTIPFSSLKNGKTLFSYNLNNLFFETFNWEEFMDCSFDVSLSIAKSETMLDMNFTVSGEIVTFCDRCLDPIEIMVTNKNFRQLIKFVENFEDVHKDELVTLEWVGTNDEADWRQRKRPGIPGGAAGDLQP